MNRDFTISKLGAQIFLFVLLFTIFQHSFAEQGFVPECSVDRGIPIPAGYPTAATTGIMGAGLQYSDLTSFTGAYNIDGQNNTVIENMDITGTISVDNSSNIIIRNCRVVSNGSLYVVRVNGTCSMVTIENCELASIAEGTSAVIVNGGIDSMIIRNCDISGGADGMKLGSRMLVEGCYIHHLMRWYNPDQDDWTHNDCLQSTNGSNMIARNNSLVAPYQQTNAVYQCAPDQGDITHVIFEGNYVSGGGNSINVDPKDGANLLEDLVISNNLFEDNSFQFGATSIGVYAVMEGNYFVSGGICDAVTGECLPNTVSFSINGAGNTVISNYSLKWDKGIYSNGSAEFVASTTTRVGGAKAGVDACFVMPFALPELNAGQEIISATFSAKNNRVPGQTFNLDLYGLPFRSLVNVSQATDYYEGAYNGDANAIALEDDMFTPTDPLGYVFTDASSSNNIVNYINAQYANGAQAGDFIFLRLNADIPDVNDYKYYSLYTGDSGDKPVLELEISDANGTISVISVSLSQTSASINEGQTLSLFATLNPTDATNQSVNWSSSNTAVATVDANGVVSGISEGTATITVTTVDGAKTASCVVTVNQIPAANQQINLGGTSSSRFTVTDLNWPSNIGDASICLWNDDKMAAASISIDDNIPWEHSWWLQMQDTYDLKFTWFIIDERIDSEDWVKYQTLVAEGNDVQGHGPCAINDYDDVRYDSALVATVNAIETNIPGYECISYAYPCGDDSRWEIAAQKFIVMRGTTGTLNEADRIDYKDLNSRSASNQTSDIDIILHEDLYLYSKSYYRGWLSYHYHTVDDKAATENFLSYLSLKSDSVWTGTYTEVAKYAQSRDSHTLTVDAVNSSEIRFTVTDMMYDAYFDFPLTVKIRIDNAWSNVTATQNGSNVPVAIVTNNGNQYALVKAVPDRGQVVINADGGSSVSVTGVDISHSSASILVNGTIDLDETILPSNADNKSVNWLSSNTAVATVDANGVVTGVSAGTADVTVTTVDGNFTASCAVTVSNVPQGGGRNISIIASVFDREIYNTDPAKYVAQVNLRVGGAKADYNGAGVYPFTLPVLNAGEEILSAGFDVNLEGISNGPQGNVDLYGIDYRNDSVTGAMDYYQGDYGADPNATALQDDFATLNTPTGIVSTSISGADNLVAYINAQYASGAQGGDAIFLRLNPDYPYVSDFKYWKFTTADGAVKPVLNLEIGVPVVSVSSVSVSQSTADLLAGQSVDLNATISPTNATNQNVSWSSSNTSVATVDANGLVNAIAEGTASITVTTEDGNYTASCTVNVTVAVSGVNISQTTASLTEGGSVDLDVTVSPANATNQDVSWSSSNTSVATVDANGLVNAVAEGTANITVNTVDGNFTASCSVTVSVIPQGGNRTVSITASVFDREIYNTDPAKYVAQVNLRVGGAKADYNGAGVYPFTLPVLNAGEEIISAGFHVNLEGISNSPQGNVDLYGIDYRSDSVTGAIDYYQGDYGADPNATALQDDFATLTTPVGIVSTSTSGAENLAAYINAQYAAGAQGGDVVFLRLNPDYYYVTDYRYWRFTTADGAVKPVLNFEIGTTLPYIDEYFSTGSANMTVIAGGTWTEANGAYTLTNPANGADGLLGNISIHNTEVSGDFELVATMNITGTTSIWNDAAIVFNYQDINNYYYVSLNESNDANTSGILKVVNGTATELADISTAVVTDVDNALEILKEGNQITVTLNGSVVASASDDTFTNGNVGFGTKNDGAIYDNLQVGAPGFEKRAHANKTTLTSLSNEMQMSVYPNPCYNSELIINLNKDSSGPLVVKLMDISGKIIINKHTTNNNIEMNVSDLKSGIYLISVQYAANNIVKKVIIR